MEWKMPLEYTELLHESRRILSKADGVLKVLWQARGGGTLDYVLAGLSVTAEVLAILEDDDVPSQRVKRRGFVRYETSQEEYICSLLDASPSLVKERQSIPGSNVSLVFWKRETERLFAALFYEADFYDGPFVREGQEAELKQYIKEVIWAKGNRLLFATQQREDRTDKYRTEVLDLPAPYIGNPDLSFYVDRLSKHAKDNLIIHFSGPSGVGKSTLALQLGEALFGPTATTLVIPHAVLDSVKLSSIFDIVGLFEPAILVIDDFTTPYEHDEKAACLALLEYLHKRVRLACLTYMTEYDTGTVRSRGLRPGRIDDFFFLTEPDVATRQQLLETFAKEFGLTDPLPKSWASQTAELTGAYIRELVRRTALFGAASFGAELKKMKELLGAAKPRAKVNLNAFDDDGKPRPRYMSKGALINYCKLAGLAVPNNVKDMRAAVAKHVKETTKTE